MRVFEMAICDDEEYWIEDICGYLKAFMSEEEVEQKSVLRFLLEKINLVD